MSLRQRIEKLIEFAIDVGVLMIPILILYMVIGLVLAFPVLWLWNWIIPELTLGTVATLTYWKAWGLIVLCSIIFGGTTSARMH